ncbi:MAG: hypothetical protein OHK0024_18370 [Thalassobaculales bacterium]
MAAALATLLVAGSAVSPAAAAGKQVCLAERDQDVFRVRALQSKLMVAALACEQREYYNSFVRQHASELSEHGKALRGYFIRVHGKSGEKELNRFVTALANEHSQANIDNRDAYCRSALAAFEELVGSRRSDIGTVSRRHEEQLEVLPRRC